MYHNHQCLHICSAHAMDFPSHFYFFSQPSTRESIISSSVFLKPLLHCLYPPQVIWYKHDYNYTWQKGEHIPPVTSFKKYTAFVQHKLIHKLLRDTKENLGSLSMSRITPQSFLKRKKKVLVSSVGCKGEEQRTEEMVMHDSIPMI